MRVVRNERLIERNARIGRYASLASMAVLVAGMYITFARPDLAVYAFAALLVGFAFSQVGIFFGNRWARRPRPDELLDRALKGIPRTYILYHYLTPAYHLLVGPAGIWVIVPKYQRGRITYAKGKWRQHGGPLLWYLRMFAQEGIGRPDLEIRAEVEGVRKWLASFWPEGEAVPEVQALLVFLHPGVVIEDVEEAPVPTLRLDELKGYLKPLLKGQRLTPEQLERIHAAVQAEPR